MVNPTLCLEFIIREESIGSRRIGLEENRLRILCEGGGGQLRLCLAGSGLRVC